MSECDQCQLLKIELENVQKMLADANAREEIQIRALIELRAQLAERNGITPT